MQVKVLAHSDFFRFEDGVSKIKLALLGREGLRPYLRTARAIRVKRGSHQVFIKTAHSDNQWRAFNLLKSSYDPADAPDKRSEPRGGYTRARSTESARHWCHLWCHTSASSGCNFRRNNVESRSPFGTSSVRRQGAVQLCYATCALDVGFSRLQFDE